MLIHAQSVYQLIHVQLVSLDFGPQGVINNLKICITSKALSSQLRVFHIIDRPKLFVAFRALNSQLRIMHIIHNPKLFITSKT